MDLTGRIALVTGASRGLGFAAARAFGHAGAQVVAVARTAGGLEELDDAIRPGGGAAVLVPLDITDEAGLARMGAALFDRFGRVDLWLHTAAYAPPMSPAEHIGTKELDQALGVNLRAFSRLIRVVDPLLRLAPEGRAVVAADAAAGPFLGLYGATKAGQAALTRSWAAETAGRITIGEILPPPMPTALRARFHPGEDRSALTPPSTVAARLLAGLGSLAHGARLDLADADPVAPG